MNKVAQEMVGNVTEEEEPKDLGLKIGSPKAVWWATIKEKVEKNILNSEESLKADRMVLKLANEQIAKESKTFK